MDKNIVFILGVMYIWGTNVRSQSSSPIGIRWQSSGEKYHGPWNESRIRRRQYRRPNFYNPQPHPPLDEYYPHPPALPPDGNNPPARPHQPQDQYNPHAPPPPSNGYNPPPPPPPDGYNPPPPLDQYNPPVPPPPLDQNVPLPPPEPDQYEPTKRYPYNRPHPRRDRFSQSHSLPNGRFSPPPPSHGRYEYPPPPPHGRFGHPLPPARSFGHPPPHLPHGRFGHPPPPPPHGRFGHPPPPHPHDRLDHPPPPPPPPGFGHPPTPRPHGRFGYPPPPSPHDRFGHPPSPHRSFGHPPPPPPHGRFGHPPPPHRGVGHPPPPPPYDSFGHPPPPPHRRFAHPLPPPYENFEPQKYNLYRPNSSRRPLTNPTYYSPPSYFSEYWPGYSTYKNSASTNFTKFLRTSNNAKQKQFATLQQLRANNRSKNNLKSFFRMSKILGKRKSRNRNNILRHQIFQSSRKSKTLNFKFPKTLFPNLKPTNTPYSHFLQPPSPKTSVRLLHPQSLLLLIRNSSTFPSRPPMALLTKPRRVTHRLFPLRDKWLNTASSSGQSYTNRSNITTQLPVQNTLSPIQRSPNPMSSHNPAPNLKKLSIKEDDTVHR